MKCLIATMVLATCLFTSGYAFAGGNYSAQTVAGTLAIKVPKKTSAGSYALRLINITLNGKVIKVIRGMDPEISKVFKSKDSTMILINFGTGGNHCSAIGHLIVGVNAKKQYKILEDVSLCGVTEIDKVVDRSALKMMWRNTATTVTLLTYANNDFRFSEQSDLKKLNSKDYDEIYYIYQQMCRYDNYVPRDINQYEMAPAGYYADTYRYYAELLETGPFKTLCHDASINEDRKPLTKEQLIGEL